MQRWLGLTRENDVSTELRRHIEGCLARQLKQRHPVEAGFYPADNRTMPRALLGLAMRVTSELPIEGLDAVIEV